MGMVLTLVCKMESANVARIENLLQLVVTNQYRCYTAAMTINPTEINQK